MAGQDVFENQMKVVGNVGYLRGLKGEDSVLIAPGNLPHPYTGSGILNAALSNGKWYRIAIGNTANRVSSALINIGRMYNHGTPSGRLLYVFADGYSGGQIVSQLAVGGSNYDIGKVRILHSGSTEARIMLDIYVKSNSSNDYSICYSNNIGFNFQSPEEVSGAVPEGYAVKEFSF